jgi:hypothetical protein
MNLFYVFSYNMGRVLLLYLLQSSYGALNFYASATCPYYKSKRKKTISRFDIPRSHRRSSGDFASSVRIVIRLEPLGLYINVIVALILRVIEFSLSLLLYGIHWPCIVTKRT